MKKESTDQVICYEESRSSVFLKYFIICMLIHAILLSFHIGHEMVDHFTIEHAKYDDEIYHPHCQSISLILSALMLWYFLIIVLIVTTRDSQSRWALSILGIPNLIILSVIFVVLSLIWLLFEHHDIHLFGSVIEFGCLTLILFISYFFYKFRKYTKLEVSYAKKFLVVSYIPLILFSGILFFNSIPYHDYLSIATTLFYTISLLSHEKQKIIKIVKKL